MGFATTAVMQYWARTQFLRRRQTPFTQGKPFHLVLDAFGPHQDPIFEEILFRQNTELTIVPGKMSMFGNVLDYELIKTFKSYLRKLMRDWFEDGQYRFTARGNFARPPYRKICEWVVECVEILNQPEYRAKWAKGFHKCGYSYYEKGCNVQLLGSAHRSLMTDQIMEGYAVLPSHEFMLRHNRRLAELGKDEVDILSDYDSEGFDIPEGLDGDVFDETLLLDMDSSSTQDTKVGDDTPPAHTQQTTARSTTSSMLTPTPEDEQVPIIPQPHLATRMTVTRVRRESQPKQSHLSSQRKEAKKVSQPQQLSISSAFARGLSSTADSQAQKKARLSNADTTPTKPRDSNICCSRKCRARLDVRAQGRDRVKSCHFCTQKCHIRCIAFDQQACTLDHVQ